VVEKEKPRVVLKPKMPVKEPVVVEVDPEVYRTIQSFVESSRKTIYPWNIGIKTPAGAIIFEKYEKWKLVVSGNVATLYTSRGRYAVILVYHDFGEYEVTISGVTFKSTSEDFDVRTIFIKPSRELPFWRYISLDEIMQAFRDYVAVEEAPQVQQEQIQTQAQ
jgi:hypothetical protein